MEFKLMLPGDYNDLYISDRQLHGDGLEYWIVVHLGLEPDHSGEDKRNFYAMVQAVVPALTPDEEKMSAMESFGYDAGDMAEMIAENGNAAWCEVLSGWASALLWQACGDNEELLLSAAKKYAEIAIMGDTFGILMDMSQNYYGATGWDVVRGNPYGKFKTGG